MANVSEELARLAQLRDQGVLTEDEFQAQKAAVLSGGTAADASIAEPKKGKSKATVGCLVLVGFIILLAIIGGMSGGGDKTASADTSAAPAQAPTEVTATELFNAYQANEAAAQQQYGDRPLLVTGVVNSIDLDFRDKPVVQLRTPNEFMSAGASLTEASQAKASGLAKGQSITLLCSGIGEVIGTPQLRECEIK